MRRLLVFDIDGCLYNSFAYPGKVFYSLCDEAGALAAQKILPDMGYDKALTLAQESFQKYHDCYGSFADHAVKTGRDPIMVRDAMFPLYHAILFQLAERKHPNFFDHTAPTKAAFDRLAATEMFDFAVLTHSCVKQWGEPLLNKMGILHHFNPKLLFGMDNYGFERKFDSPIPMGMLIAASGYDPKNIIFIEDSVRNTVPAFQAFGVPSAIIHYDSPAPSLGESVHWICRTPADFLHRMEIEFASRVNPLRSDNIISPASMRLSA